jgi:glycogen debranching enzyme
MSPESLPSTPVTEAAAAAVNLSDAVVLKEGPAFAVTLRDGTVPVGVAHPLGLFRDDCRHLSGHELRVGGALPRLLVASAPTGDEGITELTNPDLELPGGQLVPLQTLQVRLERRLSGDALEELVLVHLYGHTALELDLELALAADFRPMLALRGIVDVPAAAVDVAARPDGVVFSAVTGDGVRRSTTVTADPAPADVDADEATLRWALALEPGEHASIGLRYALGGGDPIAPSAPGTTAHRGRAGADAWLAERTRVRADDELFNRVVQRSLLDLRMLRSPLDGHEFHAAGVPWFATLFGRDSIITALEVLAFDPSVAEQTLRVLGERLGRRLDPWREEEPGKVLHELRVGEVAALGLTPLSRYYGSVDATPLFLSLLVEHTAWRGDLELFRELRGAVDAALGWIDRHGDHDGDGLLDYRVSVPEGLRNQGWKDSEDGVLDGHGVPLEPPIALVEAQAYVVHAKRGLAELFARDGDVAQARRLEAQAASLVAALERFWIPERGFYGMALDGEGRLSTALASNQGHLLWAGAVPPERARGVRDALMGEAMFSGWGIRTLGMGEAGFNPVGYHLGTVWPHDTAIAAAGLRRYGFDEDFTEVFEALLEAASHAEAYRLPELFAGFSRTQFETPVPYPVACHPQAWAAAAIPYLLTSGLGLRPDGLERRLRVRRPSLPRWVDRVEVEGLRVADARVDLLFERAANGDHVALTDARIQGEVEVVLEISGSR